MWEEPVIKIKRSSAREGKSMAAGADVTAVTEMEHRGDHALQEHYCFTLV